MMGISAANPRLETDARSSGNRWVQYGLRRSA